MSQSILKSSTGKENSLSIPSCHTVKLDSYAGEFEVQWDNSSESSPMGQLIFFTEFLKVSGLFENLISSFPLNYSSNNSSSKKDIVGTLMLSVLSGHNRYAHSNSLIGDKINPKLLGMKKIVSDHTTRRGIKSLDYEAAKSCMEEQMHKVYEDLLSKDSWILDIDTTVKTIYGNQENAVVGYNPLKRGRPSHCYHSYIMANTRVMLDVEVRAGNQSSSYYDRPRLVSFLSSLPEKSRPAFARGDIGYGTDGNMSALESMSVDYLFKIKCTSNIKKKIKQIDDSNWQFISSRLMGKESSIKLSGWDKKRRIIILRQSKKTNLGVKEANSLFEDDPTYLDTGKLLSCVILKNDNEKLLKISNNTSSNSKTHTKPSTDITLSELVEQYDIINSVDEYKYSILVTSLSDDIVTIVKHYKDRGDCENVFDELKNQWGWNGFTTYDFKRCRIMAMFIALIYNWWSIFVQMVFGDKRREAITSRPLLLSSIARNISHAGKKLIKITTIHAEKKKIQKALVKVSNFFKDIKSTAPQLTPKLIWIRILDMAFARFFKPKCLSPPN